MVYTRNKNVIIFEDDEPYEFNASVTIITNNGASDVAFNSLSASEIGTAFYNYEGIPTLELQELIKSIEFYNAYNLANELERKLRELYPECGRGWEGTSHDYDKDSFVI